MAGEVNVRPVDPAVQAAAEARCRLFSCIGVHPCTGHLKEAAFFVNVARPQIEEPLCEERETYRRAWIRSDERIARLEEQRSTLEMMLEVERETAATNLERANRFEVALRDLLTIVRYPAPEKRDGAPGWQHVTDIIDRARQALAGEEA